MATSRNDTAQASDDLRPEYDFRSLRGVVRGKYAARYRAGNTDREKRSEQYISDASYVRQQVIPAALKAERWNIVVFECIRVAELLHKGIVALRGDQPEPPHELSELIGDFIRLTTKRPESESSATVAFTATFDAAGNYYAVHIERSRLSLARQISGLYTDLARQSIDATNMTWETLLEMRLEIEEKTVSLWVGDHELFRHTDSSLSGPFPHRLTVVREANETRIARLRNAIESLRNDRTADLSRGGEYSRDEAFSAIHKLDEILQVGLVFFPVTSQS